MGKEVTELKDEALDGVVGGKGRYCPGDDTLKTLGLDGIVDSCFSYFAKDSYYKTKRDDGTWKKVGSQDMLNYVGSVVGWDSEQYNALKSFYETGQCWYQNQHLTFRW